MQDDCNLVVYGPGGSALWATNRPCGRHLFFTAVGLSDGNVPYKGTAPIPYLDQIGANASMVWLWWKDGQKALTADQNAYIAAAGALGRPLAVILTSVYNGGVHPRTPERRADFCAMAKELAGRPEVYGILIGNEPNAGGFFGEQTSAPSDYVRLLRTCYPMIKDANPGVVVLGPSLDHMHTPADWIRKMGTFYRSLTNPGTILDVWTHHPYPKSGSEKPDFVHTDKYIAMGDISDLRAAINDGFGGTAQGGATKKPIWYTELGVTHPGGTPSALQNADPIAWYERAYWLAACQPNVKGFFSFQLFDDPSGPGAWQSGLLFSNWTPKGDLNRIGAAVNAARTGSVNCAMFPAAAK
jgi:hypothetical protein